MLMNSKTISNKMETSLTAMWVNFFTAAGIPSDVSATYALTFTENRIQNDMLLDLNKEYLRDMGISRMGDVIAILRHAKQVHENTARDRVLSSAAATNKVPVAAVTGRTTVAAPTSPASRILGHYTRNPQTRELSPVAAPKRKSLENISAPSESPMAIKKARLIRFGSPPQSVPVVKEVSAASSKQTVFARLGNSDAPKPAPPKMAAKQIYSRLGTKPAQVIDLMPIEKDALRYEGILKSQPIVKKVYTVTTSQNNVRKIAVGCTMRADEAPISVKDKLNLPKPKSVKFSNHVEYKEIEGNKKDLLPIKKVPPKFTTVFNKPERRLSMPEGVNNGVKARLGMKSPNDLTITRNVFNRLGA